MSDGAPMISGDVSQEGSRLYGGVEAGGTKFMCAIGDETGQVLDQTRIETRDPNSTLTEVCGYFDMAIRKIGPITAIGVGAFGPLDLRPSSPTFGFITSTPKPGWRNTDLAGILNRAIQRQVYIDTDVNAAALAELRWGNSGGVESIAYVTVGTGIGVGVAHFGRAVHGLMHPEIGHIFVRRHPADASFAGICPYHGDCLEGLACGPAIVARTRGTLQDASSSDPIWAIVTDYLGQLCAQLVLTHSPQRILIGGGVMQPLMYSAVHERMLYWLQDYIRSQELRSPQYVSAPQLGSAAGIKGAFSLAITAGNAAC